VGRVGSATAPNLRQGDDGVAVATPRSGRRPAPRYRPRSWRPVVRWGAEPGGWLGPVGGTRDHLVRQERESPGNDEKRRDVGCCHPPAPGPGSGPDARDGNDGGGRNLQPEPRAAGARVGPLGQGGTQQYAESDAGPDAWNAGKRSTRRPWLPCRCNGGRTTLRRNRRPDAATPFLELDQEPLHRQSLRIHPRIGTKWLGHGSASPGWTCGSIMVDWVGSARVVVPQGLQAGFQSCASPVVRRRRFVPSALMV
jgi:hypothetical protein